MSEIGGQAVVEGVMMRSSSAFAVAVRNEKGKIVVKKEKMVSAADKLGFFKLPFFRGMLALYESLVLGFRALFWSANIASGKEEEFARKDFVIAVLFAVVFAFALFVAVPFYLTTFITKENSFLFNFADGMIRIAIFFIYLILISLMKDIKVMFMYHGAEHKAVNAFEAGEKLAVKNLKKYSTVHVRCGTSFLLIVLLVAVFLFSVIPSDSWVVRIASRIVLLPAIAGVSYELLRFSSRFKKNPFVGFFFLPGLLLQKLTAREPTGKQMEVAIAALRALL